MNNTLDTIHSAAVYGLDDWIANVEGIPTAGSKSFEAVLAESLEPQGSAISDNPLRLSSGFQPNQPTEHVLPRAEFFEIEKPEITRYQLLRKLEGTVVRKENDYFVAHLAENSSDFPFIEVEIDFSELPKEERSLAVEGASLVWTVVYRHQGGTRKRESEIYFRRLPAWTSSEAEKALASAQDILNAIRE